MVARYYGVPVESMNTSGKLGLMARRQKQALVSGKILGGPPTKGKKRLLILTFQFIFLTFRVG